MSAPGSSSGCRSIESSSRTYTSIEALAAIDGVEDAVDGAAIVAYRITSAEGFTEGNKRTALLLARWLLDHNGVDGAVILPPEDHAFADLLVEAAAGVDVEQAMRTLLNSRR